MLGKIEVRRRRGITEAEMVGWHHRHGHELGPTLGDDKGQGSLACCSQWGHRVTNDLVTEKQQQSG